MSELSRILNKIADFRRGQTSVATLLEDQELSVILSQLQQQLAYPYTHSSELALEPFGILKALHDSALAIIITDARQKILYASPQIEVLTGYALNDLVNKTPKIFQSGQTPSNTYQELFTNLQSGQSWAGEFFNRRKNGSYYWEWCVISPVFNQQNELAHFIAIKQDITQRKFIETELKYQSTLLASLGDPILSTDLEMTVLSWSDSAEAFYGWSQKQVIGQNWLELQPSCIFKNTNRDAVLQEVREKGAWHGEVIQHHARGHELLVYMSCSLIHNAQNKPAGLVFINRDLTQNHALQKALFESENRFKQVADKLAEGIWSIDFNDHKMNYMSPSLAVLGGLKYQELFDQPELWRNQIHPEDLPNYLEFTKTPLNTPRPGTVSIEYRFITPCGQEKWLSSRMYANADNSQKNQYWGITEDITLRKRAEADIIRSQQFAYGVLGSLSSHICVLDRSGMILATNGAWDLFADQNQGDGNYLGWNYLSVCQNAQGEEKSQALKVHNGLVSVLDGSQQSFSLEYPCHCEYEKRWFELKANRIEGDPEGRVVVFHQNITLQKKAQESLRKLNENLEEEVQLRTQALNQSLRDLQEANQKLIQANQMKDAFLANMSHELRTPLTGILGMSDLLCQEVLGPLNPKQTKSLQTLRESGQHLLTLINDILDLSKVEAGKLELHPEWIDVSESVQQILSMVKTMATDKDVRLSLKIEPFDLKIWADPRCFKQMLVNLLSNAIKFTPNNGNVAVESWQKESFIHLAVIDSGIGIDESNLNKLFEPFVQIDSGLNRKYAGTGLGLSLVKNLIEAHGGTIKVKSRPQQGSSFILRFSKDPVQSIPFDQLKPSGFSIKEAEPETRLLVLLIDDNPVNIEVIQSYLEYSGYQVLAVNSGKKALAWLEKNTPDLIFMDIQMPEMSGFELIEKLRGLACQKTAELPVIALTSLAMTGDQEKIVSIQVGHVGA